MYRRNEIIRKEALSKMNYKNAVNCFVASGLISPDRDKDLLDAYVEKVQFYRRYLPT